VGRGNCLVADKVTFRSGL